MLCHDASCCSIGSAQCCITAIAYIETSTSLSSLWQEAKQLEAARLKLEREQKKRQDANAAAKMAAQRKAAQQAAEQQAQSQAKAELEQKRAERQARVRTLSYIIAIIYQLRLARIRSWLGTYKCNPLSPGRQYATASSRADITWLCYE